MNRHLFTLLCLLSVSATTLCQTYTPVAVTGFNIDGIADATDATLTTSRTLDGSGYVLYSQSYGLRYGTGAGLPGDGIITDGMHSYQLQLYKVNNILYVESGQTDSFVLSTPSSFASLSLLAMSTDGNGTNTYTVRFTDGTVAIHSNIPLHDWFNGGNAVITGLDRAQRSNGNPDYDNNNPRLYANDLALNCADRTKLVRSLVVHNVGGSKTCILGLSGSSVAGHAFTNTDPGCPSGNDGSAVLHVTGGIRPYLYAWSTTPVQHTARASALASDIYTVTVQDSLGCTILAIDTLTDAIGQGIVTASADTVCAGSVVALSTGGAAAYMWSTGSIDSSIMIVVTGSQSYRVTATRSDGCRDTASITVESSICSGIEVQGSQLYPSIYPNPGVGSFSLSLYREVKEMQVRVTDIQGSLIYITSANGLRVNDATQINIANIRAGVYLLTVIADGQQSVHKIAIE